MPRYKEDYSLYPRKMQNGKVVWYYRTYNANGGRTAGKSTGETSKTKARLFCQELLKEGKLVPEKDLRFRTYAENWWIWDKCCYVKSRLMRSEKDLPRITRLYVKHQRAYLDKYLLPEFGEVRIRNITAAGIESFLFKLDDGNLSHAYINQILGCLRIMLGKAERDGVIYKNPMRAVTLLHNDHRVRGILTLAEVKQLFAGNALAGIWENNLLHYTINMLALCTGLRLGMIRGIREEDYCGRYIHIAHSYGRFGLGPTKNKRVLDVPVPQKLQNCIGKLVGKGGFIFSDAPGGRLPVGENKIRRALYNALHKIGIEEEVRRVRYVDFHSWRHFFNTYCKRLNIQDDKIQRVTGHRSAAMVAHYTHFELEDYREVAEAQERLLG